LQPGDVVVDFNGRAVIQPRDLAEAVAEVRPGSQATVTVLRNGQRVEQKVTIARAADTREARATEEAPQQNLGLALAPVRGGQGVMVSGVRPDSIAAAQGLQPGDVILRAGDQSLRAPRDLTEAVKTARRDNRPAIALQVERDGGRAFIALPLKAS
jgi:serine protease Do